jgi:MFS family permease
VSATTSERVRYRAVLANREFAALYGAQCLSLLGDQLARIAIAILVFQRTDSPLAASSTYAVSYLTYLFGGPLLAGLADRYPRLVVMVCCDLVRAPLVLLLCIEGLPMWLVFGLVGLLGGLAPAFDSARSALQPDVLRGESYVVGNALLNVTMQVSQVIGFVLGGTVVALTSVRGDAAPR